jgi:hypothetical protein
MGGMMGTPGTAGAGIILWILLAVAVGVTGGFLSARALHTGRVFDGAKTAPPLTLIFPGKTTGIYRKDGAERGVPWIEPGHVQARFDLIQTPS